ncbi:Crossover junction endodeoxyribonuclease RusA, partial [Haemophilus influenzae]
CSKN